jgi:hypothetical protein
MGTSVFPAPSAGGGIKSVQRGSAGSSGNVTITAVDISKSFVNVYGTSSSGTVAASGSVTGNINSSNITGSSSFADSGVPGFVSPAIFWPAGSTKNTTDVYQNTFSAANMGTWTINRTINSSLANSSASIGSGSISGGSNNLVAAVVQGFLANSTTLTVSGACRWEVVEFA